MNCWLFYAGPENFLDRAGIHQFAGHLRWSCTADVASGDLAILYRRSLAKLSVAAMVEAFGMTAEVAQAVKRQAIGSDLAAVWRVTSGNLGPLHDWDASCDVGTSGTSSRRSLRANSRQCRRCGSGRICAGTFRPKTVPLFQFLKSRGPF